MLILKATCDPQCQNGGKCISYNVCQCSKEFRGKYCQWNIERCSPKKLLFNGSYKCSGNADSLSCSLSCPNGIEFEFKPAEVYTCRYDIGEFSPRQVPKCIFGEIIF